MRTVFWIVLVFAAIASVQSGNAACPGAPANYKGYDKASFAAGDGRVVAPDGLKLTAAKNSYAIWFSDATVIDAWTCVSLRFPEATPNANPGAGIVFWKRDAQNFYMALMRRNGIVGTFQHSAAGWRNIRTDNIGAFNPGTSNQIEVVTLGDLARVIVNGRTVMETGSNMGADPLAVGIYAEASSDGPASWLIDSVSIISLCHGHLAGYC
jgi:hypothetical protein